MANVLSKRDISTRAVLTEKSPFVVFYMPLFHEGNCETTEKYLVKNCSFSEENYEIVDGFYKGYLVKKVFCSKIQIR
jgi:hypothetical protein